MQAADHVDLALAGLQLGLQPRDEGAGVLRLEIDRRFELREDRVAHCLRFGHGRRLARPEQQLILRLGRADRGDEGQRHRGLTYSCRSRPHEFPSLCF